MTPIYTKAEEHQLVKNTLMTTLDTMGKEWKITHDFKPTSFSSGWAASLRMVTPGVNGQYSLPTVWPSGHNGKMVVGIAVSGNKDYQTDIDRPPVDAWTTIAISQTLEGNKYMYRISIGGQEVHAKENTQPKVYQGAEVYASKGTAQPGSIRNLVIETRVQE